MEHHDDPYALFHEWFAEAEASEPRDPQAAALATAATDGMPSVRMVLIKKVDARGFVFYTNLGSRKAGELQANPKAALCLHWKSIDKQIRVEGDVEPVSDDEADAYFASRARGSRIGAWASKQSQTLPETAELGRRVEQFTESFGEGEVPRPEFWSGFRIKPRRIEYWCQGEYRLHDRLEYARDGESWGTRKLFP